jgi:hypothetical protein
MFKTLSLLLLVSASALAAPKPLITKSSGGGYMMPIYAGFETCEVYADRVVITRHLGNDPTGVALTETRKLEIQGDLRQTIIAANQEKTAEKENGLCDGPSTSISADAGSTHVELFSTGGCGTPSKFRSGPYTERLKSIAALYCPKTYGAED